MGAVQHPLAGSALEGLVVAERDRVRRLAHVRELILVGRDGLFVCAAAAAAGCLVSWLGEASFR